ncbi:MAG TPA: hypothetical protein VFZ91_16605 [Allosphingosinicella sp.]
MTLSIEAAALLGALALGSATAAPEPDGLAHYGRAVDRSSLLMPDKPPCVDGALIGRLRPTGERELVALSPDYRSTRRWFEFQPRATLFGPAAPPAIRFGVIGNPHLPDRDNMVMLVRRTPDGSLESVNTELFIRDWRGREFIPLVWPPLRGLRGSSWLPIGF